MNTTPASLRLQIGLFGRTNTGKSSLMNFIAGQDVAITSPVPGTTTDVVIKPIELLPVGPVLLLDTGGIDDPSILGTARIERTRRALARCEVAVLVIESGTWTIHEEAFAQEARARNLPLLGVITKIDLRTPDEAFIAMVRERCLAVLQCACTEQDTRDEFVDAFKRALMAHAPENTRHPVIIDDLVPAGGLAVLIVPIDLEAPRGRIILPQVQVIRNLLDVGAAALVVKEHEFAHALTGLNRLPDLVVCDSQVVKKMTAYTPPAVKCTTFSILFARFKGDLPELARGAATLHRLRAGDLILIAEACSHHALEDDIGRIKIPRWIERLVGGALHFDVCSGHDYPADLERYRLVIHCGGCMLNRRAMLNRQQAAAGRGVPVTNYGLAIATALGVIERVLSPFPAALLEYRQARASANPTGVPT